MVIWMYFSFQYYSGLYTMQEPSYLGEITLEWIRLGWYWPKERLGYKRFSHLDIPTKDQYLTGITILIPIGRFFDTMCPPIYKTALVMTYDRITYNDLCFQHIQKVMDPNLGHSNKSSLFGPNKTAGENYVEVNFTDCSPTCQCLHHSFLCKWNIHIPAGQRPG